jgi:hypothetical protein
MIPKKRPGRVLWAAGMVLAAVAASVAGPERPSGPAFCDPTLTALFTPRHPRLGRFEVCTDPRPLAEVVPAGWAVEALEVLDAFGAARSYDRAGLARLYGGVRARVARGWTRTPDRFESRTYISPYPNAAMTSLEWGTLVIRWTCDNRQAGCGITKDTRNAEETEGTEDTKGTRDTKTGRPPSPRT